MSQATHPSDRARIAVITGTRAEFGLLEGVMHELNSCPSIELQVFVTGMHLRPEFGRTEQLVADRFPITACVPAHPPTDDRAGMALALSAGIAGFIDAFTKHEPHWLLLLGDRTEILAASLAAAYLDIPIAHIHGGDVSGNPVDDFQRDAISRLARLHFAATPGSAQRLRQLGVTGAIQVVGAPGLDDLSDRPRRDRATLCAKLGLGPESRWLVALFHPNPAHVEESAELAQCVLEACWQVAQHRSCSVVILRGNSDAGHGDQARVVDEFVDRAGPPEVHCFQNLERDDYLDLLAHAELLLGNSSSGVIESAALGVATVDVGDRQQGRERDANVVQAAVSTHAIVAAADRAFTDRRVREAVAARKSVYGDGGSAQRIFNELLLAVGSAQPEHEGQTA